jgi:phosphoribosylformylglycinamidine cyclo-ligase
MVDGKATVPGDVVLGIASSGLHSNGYSLVRKIVFDHAGLGASDRVDWSDRTIGELLLEPTRLYVRPVRSVLNHYTVKSVVHAIAHITGGGLHENLARVLPPTVDAVIERGSWPTPPVFTWLQQLGDVEDAEMARVFNMGVGLALVVSEYYAESIQQQISQQGFECWPIGAVVEGRGDVRWA